MKRAIVLLGLAAVASSPAFGDAGVPSELLGHFGNSPVQCRSFHRKADNITHISKEYYTFCGGSRCEARIDRVRKTKSGYTLKLQGDSGPFDIRLTKVEEGVFDAGDQTLVKCTERDQIAGIGLPVTLEMSITKAPHAAFSAYYALSVPEVCRDIKVDEALAESIAKAGILEYVRFLLDRKLIKQTVDDAITTKAHNEREDARYAVKQDAEAIPAFCDHVLDAFGENGRIFKDILSDNSQKI
ncbi:hypothetical protein [Mesorhizobium sp.]|uniref:hypothetical protein n=1 Tax=Mesorhizobium sp. TaxID=1871066 RepID=UPI000FE5597C|nr:hypothetical protein [Mesorhizobium sp.]RWA98302.1 MAG: hypothetical protein EOQ33_27680 [Mesorhizobium sp.]